MARGLYELEKFLLDFFFPRQCVTCKKESAWVCQSCRNSVIAGTIPQTKEEDGLKVTSWFDFNTATIRELLHNLKYNGIREVAPLLVDMAIETATDTKQLGVREGIIIPVPTSKAKLKIRGYNQSEELACELANRTRRAPVVSLLQRTGKMTSQVGKDKNEREHQAQGVFVVNSVLAEIHRNQPLILVDDLYTTGSTVRACVKELLKVSNVVSVITVARDW